MALMFHAFTIISALATYQGPLGTKEMTTAGDFEANLSLCEQSVPQNISERINNWKENDFKNGYLYIEGVDTTPEEASQLMCGISQKLDHIPVGFATERNGDLIHHLQPSKAEASSQTSRSSNVILELHQELAFMPKKDRPRFIILYGVQQDFHKEAETGVYDFRDLKLSPKEMEIATRKNWYCGTDEAVLINGKCDDTDPESHIVSNPFQMIKNVENNKILDLEYFDDDCGLSTDEELLHLRKKISDMAMKGMTWLKVKKGDILIIDNNFAVHSRKSFRATYDESTDRHLLRTLASRKDNAYLNKKSWTVNFEMCSHDKCNCLNKSNPAFVKTLKSKPSLPEAHLKRESRSELAAIASPQSKRIKL